MIAGSVQGSELHARSKLAWGKLPNSIATDPNVLDSALVLLAYRLTLAGKWCLHWLDARRIVRRGLRERSFWRALNNLRAVGLIRRKITPVSGTQGRGRVENDEPILPEYGKNYRRVERRWFDGTMTVKGVALLIYVRARGGLGTKPWCIVERFDWSLPTVRKTAEELIAAGLIENRGGHTQAPVYVEPNCKIPQYKKAQSKICRSKKTQSLLTVTSQHIVSPLPNVKPEHSAPLQAKGQGTDSLDSAVENKTAVVVAESARGFSMEARGAVEKPKQRRVMDRDNEPVRLSDEDRRTIAELGGDPDELFDRMSAQIKKGTRIGHKVQYMVEIAKKDAARAAGVPVGVVSEIVTGNRFARAEAMGRAMHADLQLSSDCLKRVNRHVATADRELLLMAWRKSCEGRSVPDADRSFEQFANSWRFRNTRVA